MLMFVSKKDLKKLVNMNKQLGLYYARLTSGVKRHL